MKYQLLIVVLLGLSLGTGGAWGGATDISGTWACDIHPGGDARPPILAFVFKQAGEKLTGDLSLPAGEEAKVTGTVKGDKAVFSYESKPPAGSKKGSLTVTFNGTIESPSKITGVIGKPFCDSECKWTATKQKK